MSEFNIESIITNLQQRRQLFVSEADFQLEMAWVIKELYPASKVRLEYTPRFNPDMHIDILVIFDNNWIPIELKYKTKGCTYNLNGDFYYLKNHGAKDVNCYLYLKDIQRIETIKNHVPFFQEGYTVFLTNEQSYLKAPLKNNCIYKAFSLEDGIEKTGTLDWSPEASDGTKKNCEEPIILNQKYKISWKEFSKLDNSSTGKFLYLVNKII